MAAAKTLARVHVWLATLDRADLSLLWWLDDRELGRFHGYHHDADRARFLLGAAMLRSAVGAQLDLSPQEVVVTRTCHSCDRWHGPPSVQGSSLSLSVSHGGLLVALASADSGSVGIDVERTGGRTGEEAASWTRAEARFKAGDGPGLVVRELPTPIPGHVLSLASAADVQVEVSPATELLAAGKARSGSGGRRR